MTAQQLKNSILQMAVQGKLVPQDPNDEPASVLLERIKAEKEELIKAGKIKKDKKSSEIFRGSSRNLPYAFCEQIGNEIRDISDEIPFDIPDTWEWCRLGICLDVRDGTHDTPKYVPQGIPLVTSKNLCNGHIDFTTAKFISVQDHEAISQRSKVDNGDIMFAMIGSIGNPVLYYGNEEFSIKNMALFKRLENGLDMSYVYWYLFFVQTEMKKIASGGVQSFVSLSYLRNYFIPVPPLNEQQRIVAKIEELLPYIEKYGKAEEHLTALNITFPEALKKSILQEAVQGKLVPQNPDDEPASVLLERIRAEKQALIKAGKIKKDKHESVIITRDKIPYEIIDGKERCIADEVPFELPDSWCWCRLSDIVSFIGGYAYNSSDFIQKSRNQVLRLGNVKNDELKLSAKPVFISDELANDTIGFMCKVNDILITMTGTRLKRDYFFTVRILDEAPTLYINQRVGCLRSFNSDMAHWLTWILKSETVLSQVFQYETGTANQGNLGAENILKTLIPLPPLAEQKRIVEKIEELMPIISTISK